MAEVITIGLDIAKNVFQVHGADAGGHQVFSWRIASGKVLETCGGAYHSVRKLIHMGHELRLIPPADVKAFVKLWRVEHHLTNHEVPTMRSNAA